MLSLSIYVVALSYSSSSCYCSLWWCPSLLVLGGACLLSLVVVDVLVFLVCGGCSALLLLWQLLPLFPKKESTTHARTTREGAYHQHQRDGRETHGNRSINIRRQRHRLPARTTRATRRVHHYLPSCSSSSSASSCSSSFWTGWWVVGGGDCRFSSFLAVQDAHTTGKKSHNSQR